MAKFPKYNFERRITDHRIPFARYHHGNFSMFTPGYMKANVQFALRQLWGGYQFFIMCGMLGFFSTIVIGKLALYGIFPDSFKGSLLKTDRWPMYSWAISNLAGSNEQWDLVTGTVESDTNRLRDFPRQKKD